MTLCFAITHCDRDASLAELSAAALKSLYPDAHIVVIEDKPRLKLPQFSGQWTQRWMEEAVATGADIIIKLDPDTRAKNVAAFPEFDIFGQVSPDGTYPQMSGIICGACIGFQKAAVEKILSSGFLLDAKYSEKPYAATERRYQPWETVSLQDPIVHDVAQRLGLSQGSWAGLSIKFSWDAHKDAHPRNATFVHPVGN
jgi:hypothetical protein